jgi:dihydrofolate reductase
MEGGTEFRFVDGIHSALKQAVDAAGGQDVRLGGGVSAIRQYIQAGLVDEMHLAIAHACCSAPANISATDSTFQPSGTSAPNTFRVPEPRTSLLRGAANRFRRRGEMG